jgi:rubrerythrin
MNLINLRALQEGAPLGRLVSSDTEDDAPPAYICKRCGQTMTDRDESEGCEDPICPAQEPHNDQD